MNNFHPDLELKRLYAELTAGLDMRVQNLCRRCLKVKSTLAFAHQKRNANGIRTYCRQCARTPQTRITRTEKPCQLCGRVLPIEEFFIKKDSPDGRQPRCPSCNTAAARRSRKKNRAKAHNIKWRYCCGCDQTKPATEFYTARFQSDGLTSRCKPCTDAYHQTPRAKAHASRNAALLDERRHNINIPYTREETDLALSYREATVNDPCSLCSTSNHPIFWIHRIPSRKGGRDLWHNLMRACISCTNRRKYHTDQCLRNDRTQCICR